MILEIIKYPNKILNKKTKKVGAVDAAVKKLIDDMAETMYAGGGVGLAANQVGEARQIIMVDDGSGLKVLINPKIIKKRGRQVASEGCLSFPGLNFPNIKRPQKIEVRYKTRREEIKTLKAQDLLARAICHEADHLAGKTVLDRVGFFERKKIKKKLKQSQ